MTSVWSLKLRLSRVRLPAWDSSSWQNSCPEWSTRRAHTSPSTSARSVGADALGYLRFQTCEEMGVISLSPNLYGVFMQHCLDASDANFSPLAVLDIFLAVLAPALQRQDPRPWLGNHLTELLVLARRSELDRPHNNPQAIRNARGMQTWSKCD